MRRRGLFVVVLGATACLVENSSETGEAWLETDAAPSSSSSSSTSGDSSSTTSSASTSSSSSGGESSGSTTTAVPTTSPPDDDGGGPPSLGPACSVQEVTRGAEYNPLPRAEPGAFPFEVADAFEDFCGCHTLADNEQNIEWEFLRPPDATLFLTHADLSRSYDGGTLGEAMATALDGGMPPGSCPHPDEPLALLAEWFAQGMPPQE